MAGGKNWGKGKTGGTTKVGKTAKTAKVKKAGAKERPAAPKKIPAVKKSVAKASEQKKEAMELLRALEEKESKEPEQYAFPLRERPIAREPAKQAGLSEPAEQIKAYLKAEEEKEAKKARSGQEAKPAIFEAAEKEKAPEKHEALAEEIEKAKKEEKPPAELQKPVKAAAQPIQPSLPTQLPPRPVPRIAPSEAPPRIPPFVAPLPQGPIAITFGLLPEWEDKERLRKAAQEEGITFLMAGIGTPEYKAAMALLLDEGERPAIADRRTLICARSSSGEILGALECSVLRDSDSIVLVLERAGIKGYRRKRDLHQMLCAIAFAMHTPTHVVCLIPKPNFYKAGVDSAGRLIFLGQALGMSALKLDYSGFLLIRRIGREMDPMISGPELGSILGILARQREDKALAELAVSVQGRGPANLIKLPTSPDSREQLHELEELVVDAGLPQDGVSNTLELLKTLYVMARSDITPAFLL